MGPGIELTFVDFVSYLIPGFLVVAPATWLWIQRSSAAAWGSVVLTALFLVSFFVGFTLYHLAAYIVDGTYHIATSKYPTHVMVEGFPQYSMVRTRLLNDLELDSSIKSIDVYLWSRTWTTDSAPKSLAQAERVAYIAGFARVLAFTVPISAILLGLAAGRRYVTAISVSFAGVAVVLVSIFLFRTYWVLSQVSVHQTMRSFLVNTSKAIIQ